MLHALVAQAPAPAPAPGGELPFFANPLFMVAMVMLFVMVVVLPGSRRARKQEEAMRAGLKRGMKVVTMSGVIGTITGIRDGDEEITLRSEDTKLRVLRSSVLRVLGSDEAEAGKTS